MTDLPVETPQGISSPDERIQILIDELELAIRWQRPCILFAVYSSEYVRADAQTLLENQVMDLGQEVTNIRVRNGQGNGFFQFLHQDGTQDNVV